MTQKTITQSKNIALVVIIGLFTLSLITKVYTLENGSEVFGYEAFFAGWMELFGTGLAWLANPVAVAAIIYFWLAKFRISAILGAIGFVFAVAFYYYSKNKDFGILSIGASYYIWTTSILAVLIASVLFLKNTKK